MTIGTDRVRVSFNPSADSVVDQIKQKTADLTDLCETLRMQRVDDPETLMGMDNLQARRPRADLLRRGRDVGGQGSNGTEGMTVNKPLSAEEKKRRRLLASDLEKHLMEVRPDLTEEQICQALSEQGERDPRQLDLLEYLQRWAASRPRNL